MSNNFDETYDPKNDFLPGESESKSLQSLHKQIGQLVAEQKDELLPKKGFLTTGKSILLAFLILSAIGMLFYFSTDVEKVENIPMAYFEAYPNYQQFQVRGMEKSDILESAYSAYDNKAFDQAIKKFNKKYQQLNSIDLFYLAVAYQAEEQWPKSLTVIKKAEDGLDKKYLAAHQWHYALGQLAVGEKEEAIQRLKNIKSGNSPFANSANKILEKLKE